MQVVSKAPVTNRIDKVLSANLEDLASKEDVQLRLPYAILIPLDKGAISFFEANNSALVVSLNSYDDLDLANRLFRQNTRMSKDNMWKATFGMNVAQRLLTVTLSGFDGSGSTCLYYNPEKTAPVFIVPDSAESTKSAPYPWIGIPVVSEQDYFKK